MPQLLRVIWSTISSNLPAYPKIAVSLLLAYGTSYGTTQRRVQIAPKDDPRNLAARFHTQLKIPVSQPETIKRVIYGNEQYGYFATSDYRLLAKGLVIGLVPPGYRHKISFFVERSQQQGKWHFIGTKLFASPVPKLYQSLTGHVNHGRFSNNYFMVAGALARSKYWNPNQPIDQTAVLSSSKYRYSFFMILNRLGEIVWLHVPQDEEELFHTYIQGKQVAKGQFGLILGKKVGLFQLIRYDGQIIHSLRSRDVQRPFTMHHDFVYAANDSILAISTRSAKTQSNRAKRLGATFLADTIIQVDLKSGSSQKVFDFLPHYTPHADNFWTGDDSGDHKFVLWNQSKVDFDFLHLNSLQELPEGYLVGIRNLNKIAMLDKKFTNVVWSLGPSRKDTFYINNPKDQFHHLHTPLKKPNGNVMLFDNGFIDQSSRVIEYQLDTSKKTAAAIWSYTPQPRLYSKDRGSIVPAGERNVLVYFVNPIQGKFLSPPPKPRDIMVEVDYQTRKEVARMTRYFDVLSPGYRATPIDTIGMETFLGPAKEP